MICKLFVPIIVLATVAINGSPLEKQTSEEIPITQKTVDEINRLNVGFKAKLYPEFAGLTLEQLRIKTGVSSKPSKHFRLERPNRKVSKATDNVPAFDIVDKWPECKQVFTDIPVQGNCSALWAFAVTTSIRDRICIHDSSKIDPISAWDVISCCKDCWIDEQNGCNGGDHISALKYFEKFGIVSGGGFRSDEGCKPYPVRSNLNSPSPKQTKCVKACDSDYTKHSYEEDKRFGFHYGLFDNANENVMQEIIKNGSVVAEFELYSDLLQYSGGIYKQIKGTLLGYAYARVTGWGTTSTGESFWRGMTSFGQNWGESGSFKIARGHDEVGFESSIGVPRIKFPVPS